MHGFILLLLSPLLYYSSGGEPERFPGTNMSYYEDASASLEAEEVLRLDEFRRCSNEIPNFGVSYATYWFRFDIRNSNDAEGIFLLLEQPLHELIEIYTVSDSGSHAELLHKISNREPFFSREYPLIEPVFDLKIPPGHTGSFLMKISSTMPIVLPLKIGSQKQIMQLNLRKEVWLSLYTGIMLAMFLYNLFLYISIKDRSYLIYVGYILLICLTQISLPAFSFKYLWPESPFIARHAPLVFSCLTGIAALVFIKEFLRTKEFTPRLHIGIPAFNVLFISAMVLHFTGYPAEGFTIMQTTTASAALFSLFLSYRVYRLRYRPARFFLLAWSALLAGAVIFVLKDYEILPYNNFATFALLAASALEAILLSFALADKINMLRAEKEESQEQAMTAMAEVAKIEREQNILLETKVDERTHALNQTNEYLNKALRDLQEAESQLVESEKMASLGQLTAGIAHEINNPTNFVTANVNPLERDIGMIIDLFEKTEAIGLSDISRSEKEKAIDQLKQQTDYEYLKTEIDQLIKGIRDGSGRTAEIIKGLRTFSRLDEAAFKKSSINEGIESTLVIVNHMLKGKIEIIKEYGDLPLVECFPGKLNQVFLNIMTNGLQAIDEKFGDKQGGLFTIRTLSGEETVTVIFKDNGIGMDEATRSKIFEPFFTTKTVNEGIGLGMSIVYSIIKKHHGNITVRSVPAEGTEFQISLPIMHENGTSQI